MPSDWLVIYPGFIPLLSKLLLEMGTNSSVTLQGCFVQMPKRWKKNDTWFSNVLQIKIQVCLLLILSLIFCQTRQILVIQFIYLAFLWNKKKKRALWSSDWKKCYTSAGHLPFLHLDRNHNVWSKTNTVSTP